jgi:hypothetical protein
MSTIGGAGSGPGAAASLLGRAQTPSTDRGGAASPDGDRLFAALVAGNADGSSSTAEPQDGQGGQGSGGSLVSLLAPQTQSTLFQAQLDHVASAGAVAPGADGADPQIDELLKQYFSISNGQAERALSSSRFGQTPPPSQAG